MQQIADALGITRTHVARALHGSGYVRASLRSKVLREAERIGYRPNRFAVALATRRTMNIGLFIDADPSYFSAFAHSLQLALGLSDALEPRGYGLKIMPSDAASTAGIDGAVCAFGTGMAHWARLRRRDVPAVAILRREAASLREARRLSLPWVAYDRTAGLDQLAALCVKKGIRRIGLLTAVMPKTNPDLDEITGTLAKHGLSLAPADVLRVEREPETLIAQILDLMPRVRALDLCILRSEATAIPFYQAARVAGVRIPEDISVVGFDNAYYSASLHPPLSSLQYSLTDLCQQTAASLLAAIDGRAFERDVRIDTEYVERGTLR